MLAASNIVATLSMPVIATVMVSIFAAAVLRGFTGFGFALAAVPLLSLVISPMRAVPIAIVLQIVGSLFDLRSSSKLCHWPSLNWLMVGAVVGTPVGTLIMSMISAPVARLVISVITMLAVGVIGKGFALATVPARAGTSAVGFLAGIFGGLAAMPGPPAIAYYMSVPVSGATVRASLLLFFMMTSIAALASAFVIGMVDMEVLVLSTLGLPFVWLGTWIGAAGFERGGPAIHRKVSIVSLGLLSLVSAIKGLSELL